MSVDEPVRILSDLHLGHKVSRIENVSALRPLISGAATVIFNGDTWQELARQFYVRSAEMLEELKKICHEEGAHPIFLAGNHDPGWSGRGWVELAEGRIVITHGDALLFGSSPWKREILLNSERVAELWNDHPDAPVEIGERLEVARKIARELCSVEHPTGRSFLARAFDAAIPPSRALKMLESWLFQGAAGAEFCDRYFPKAELLMIGHFHRVGSWQHGRRRIVNTGSFMSPGEAHWAEWKDGWLTRGRVTEARGACRKGDTLETWRF